MNEKKKVVLGIYKSRNEAESAIDSLKLDGFFTADISVLFPESEGSQSLAHVKSSKAPEGAAAGAGTGAIIGGTLGLLAGIGFLAIPGVGPFIAAGPIMATFAGAGAGGAIGGISGALIGFGIPEYEAKKYEGLIKNGGILLSVHAETSDMIAKAKECLERTGAEDIATTSEVKNDWKMYPNKQKNMDTTNSTAKLY